MQEYLFAEEEIDRGPVDGPRAGQIDDPIQRELKAAVRERDEDGAADDARAGGPQRLVALAEGKLKEWATSELLVPGLVSAAVLVGALFLARAMARGLWDSLEAGDIG
eukprot:1326708-Prymnesium_polylepis.1